MVLILVGCYYINVDSVSDVSLLNCLVPTIVLFYKTELLEEIQLTSRRHICLPHTGYETPVYLQASSWLNFMKDVHLICLNPISVKESE